MVAPSWTAAVGVGVDELAAPFAELRRDISRVFVDAAGVRQVGGQPRFRLGIISNFTGNLGICLSELGIRDLFEIVTDSAVLGFAKPDARPFTHTIEALGLPPHATWMVGDNFEADIRPSAKLGMQTVWLAPAQRPVPAGCVPTARIASLKELPGVLAPASVAPRDPSACTA